MATLLANVLSVSSLAAAPRGIDAGALRPRRERPRYCRAAEQRDELPLSQFIELHALALARVTA